MTGIDKQTVLEALDSTIEEIRHEATRKLPEVFDKVPVDILLKALGDESWRVRKAAVELACHPDDQLLDALVQGLSSQDNAGLRNSASEVLVNAGTKAVRTVQEALKHEDTDVRKFAADILGEMKLPDTLDSLIEALGDEDENVRGAAAEAMGYIGDTRCVSDLLRSVKDDGLLVKLSSLDSLNRLGASVPFDTLESLLSVGPLRPLIFRLMGSMDDPDSIQEAAQILVSALSTKSKVELAAATSSLTSLVQRMDKNAQVKIQVAVAKSASDELCTALDRLLDSTDREQKAAAVTLLGWTGRTESVDSLLAAAADEKLCEHVHLALQAIGPKGAARLDELLDDLGRAEKVLALEMLGHYRKRSSLPGIVQMCMDDDCEVAQAAQSALGEVGDISVIPALLDILRTDGGGRKGAVGALVILGNKYHDEVFEGLKTLLECCSASTRRYVVDAICAMASKSDQVLVEKLTGDPDPGIRALAIDALSRIGASGVVEKIKMMLADESELVRLASARSLGQLDGRTAFDALVLLLRDEKPEVMIEAINSIGKNGGKEELRLIVPLLAHQNALVALSAARALGLLGWAGDTSLLSELCKNADPEVLKELLANARNWPTPRFCPLVSTALEHPRWDVRIAATKAVGSNRDQECLDLLTKRFEKEKDELVLEVMERVIGASPIELKE